MSNPYRAFSTLRTPQQQRILGSNQAANSAGGFSYTLDKWKRLERFLVLGSDGGTYYVSEQKLTLENAQVVLDCIAEDGGRTVGIIEGISKFGRAPRNTPAIFALALCASHGDVGTRRLALENMPSVCRTGTHLFQFVAFVRQHRGLGRQIRRAISDWYEDKPADKLAYQLVKYRNREGYSHRDLLRLAHPNTSDPAHEGLYAALTGKADPTRGLPLPDLWRGYQAAQDAVTPAESAALVAQYGLPWEALKTEHLTDLKVWEALIEKGLPMTALIRNLGRISGMLDPMSPLLRTIGAQLTNKEHLEAARIHPFQILVAMKTYGSGHGFRGKSSWPVHSQIMDALDDAFYASFDTLESTGKRTLLSLDVSGSMHGSYLMNTNVNAAEASCAMAMATARSEEWWAIGAFAREYTLIGMSPRERLDDLVRRTQALGFGGTDCALPMMAAAQEKWDIDNFVVLTDSETWAGTPHPSQALVHYRKTMNKPDAKLTVVGMTANNFTIADPNDAGMMDVVGFDTSTPQLIAQFASA